LYVPQHDAFDSTSTTLGDQAHLGLPHYQGESASIQSGNNFALMMGPFIGERMMGPYHPITDERIG